MKELINAVGLFRFLKRQRKSDVVLTLKHLLGILSGNE